MTPERDVAEPAAVDYLQQVRREDRLADKVADLLKKAILNGQLKPGDRLPPERVLGDRFGVSRTVIREAIRSLTAMGLVEVRSGSGSVVARASAGSVAEAVQLYLRGAETAYEAVEEVLAMLEVHVAGVAALRATDEDLQDLRDALVAMAGTRDPEAGAEHDAEFHRCLARATHNPLYPLLLDSVGAAVAGAHPETLARQGGPAAALRAHEHILDRVAARDAEGAREAMRIHLADSHPGWEDLIPVTTPEPAL